MIEDWPDFFVEDGQSLITTRDNHAKGRPIDIMYCDGRGMMRDRVTALRQAIVFEPHVYRHLCGNTLSRRCEDGTFAVESSFHVVRTGPGGATVIYGSGRYLDEIVAQDGALRFRKRTIVLDSSRIDMLLVIPR
jgi:anthranilate 1,2-dioxygenase small subunit